MSRLIDWLNEWIKSDEEVNKERRNKTRKEGRLTDKGFVDLTDQYAQEADARIARNKRLREACEKRDTGA